MINLIVATHGKMSEETVNLTKMVLGESEQLDFVTFVPGEGPEDLIKKYQDIIAKYNSEGTLFLVDLFGKKVLLTHGHLFNVKTTLKELEKKARYENVDICIFGHTHKEFLEEKNGITFVNPGALQDKKYVMYYGGKRFEQKILK